MKRTANVKRLNRSAILFSIFLYAFLISTDVGFGALLFTDMFPSYGPVGTEVTLSGAGFDPGQSYSVMINGLPCVITAKETGSISFTIPSGASSGEISVLSDGKSRTL